MIYSIKGIVTQTTKRFIVVENSGIGYEVFVANTNLYSIDENVFLFIHHHKKEDDEYLVGFKTTEERNSFRFLLHVNGIGPKTALSILNNTNYDELLVAISNNDVHYISSIPGISPRLASQIIIDLKDYIAKGNKENIEQYKSIKEALKVLGFKVKDIDPVLKSIYIPNATEDEIFKEALRRLNHV